MKKSNQIVKIFLLMFLFSTFIFVPKVFAADCSSLSYNDCLNYNMTHSDNMCYCEKTLTTNTNIFRDNVCTYLEGSSHTWNLIKSVVNIIKYVVPVLMVVLGIVDFAKASASGEEKQMKKAQSDFIKRLIIGVIIILLPTILKVILQLVSTSLQLCV